MAGEMEKKRKTGLEPELQSGIKKKKKKEKNGIPQLGEHEHNFGPSGRERRYDSMKLEENLI